MKIILKNITLWAQMRNEKIFYKNVNDYIKEFARKFYIICLVLSLFVYFCYPVSAQMPTTVLNLPAPGSMISVSSDFYPIIMSGVNIHQDQPFKFDFIFDPGDTSYNRQDMTRETKRLIKYFLTSLTIPNDDMWVNLSPHEEHRIIPGSFGETEMGRDLLAQDYVLKQLTASLLYPETELGRRFWERVYHEAAAQRQVEQIPVDMFHKVWIVPQKAVVYEHDKGAVIIESHLNVMLEQDYRSMLRHREGRDTGQAEVKETSQKGTSTSAMREIILPEIEREVNHGRAFAKLRQIYHSVVLASWYKERFREGLLGHIYINQNKITGVNVKDKEIKKKIYNQYLTAFQKGVFDYIREEYDSTTQQVVPRSYFSGGVIFPGEREDAEMVGETGHQESIIAEVTIADVDHAQINAEDPSIDIKKQLGELIEIVKKFRGGHALPTAELLKQPMNKVLKFLDEGREGRLPFMLYLEIHPTDVCQLKCKWCRGGLRHLPSVKNYIDPNKLIRFLESIPEEILADNIHLRFSGTIGEPLMHPGIVSFLKIVNKRGWQVEFVTNGILLNDEGYRKGLYEQLLKTDVVNISVDVSNDGDFQLLKGGHPGDFEKVIQNIRKFAEFRDSHGGETKIRVSCIIQEESVTKAENFARMMEDAGVDIIEYKMQHYDERRRITEQGIRQAFQDISKAQETFKNSDVRISTAQTLEDSIQKASVPQDKEFPVCYVARHGLSLAVDPLGNIQPCCQYYADTLGVMGTIESTFMEFWNSSQGREVLKKTPAVACRGNACAPSHFIQNYFLSSLNLVVKGILAGGIDQKFLEMTVSDLLNEGDNASVPGGIDFVRTSASLSIQRKEDRIFIPPKKLPGIPKEVQGFIPQIINIYPVNNLNSFLGLDSRSSSPSRLARN